MGDCIKQARAFVQGCHEALYRADDSCVQDMTAVLADIQSGAKLNRARAIYRAAQEALHCLEDETRLPLRLHALSNVVALYESGLVEMEGEEIKPEDACLEHDVIEGANIESADIIPVDFSETARQTRAVDALTTALPFADDAQKPTLEKLLALSGHPVCSNESPQAELSLAPHAKSEANSKESIMEKMPAETKPTLKGIALESFIRDIVQTGLSVARQFKLTLSLSYDMAGVTVPEDQAETLKTKAESCLASLIHHLAATSETEALSHIDISASATFLKFRTTAAPLSDVWLASATMSDAIAVAHEAKSRHLTVTLTFREKTNRTAPKMPVDEGVSARLENLLDTIETEDTDPFQLGAVL